jgi:hypothetical protein
MPPHRYLPFGKKGKVVKGHGIIFNGFRGPKEKNRMSRFPFLFMLTVLHEALELRSAHSIVSKA